MLSISHGLSGAFIATALPQPVHIPLILACHYLQDWIPHWDVGTGLSTRKRTIEAAVGLEIIDLLVTAAAITYLWGLPNLDPVTWLPWWGCFVALLPDFIEAPKNFFNWEPAILKPLNRLHNNFHTSTTQVTWGLAPQLMLVALIGVLVGLS